ncbi:hypothetical protein [Enterococcus termitis]|uniref:Uncharacterized protein n=1 Tax=Enterococcus termitis TaxID=332950 RepID=A0A1E5GZR6_9ENTE|nr:hypothetical protein [Enterococcus termitis]OEG18173.1 hypothetical protein BCR25_16920 [Enterococcus termitis]OJG97207.1 hypothetical protein RV18_GL001072 [Enterococcus termitis]
MTPKEAAALNHYLTTPPEEFYKEIDEVDETENWNKDDKGTIVSESDWVFVAYFKKFAVESGKLSAVVTEEFVVEQNGFLDLLEEKGADRLLKEKLEIISGKEWLSNR